ncbi:hypothetical protein OSB04_000234 [Centaurea solstitialis]|uniref:DUF4283 domain-containing protein n=1 Tax=Centaurea solstitialis TaxID=347529 RepID=A0AA38TNN9_9ASTR|nr:hypothetical protein OSB04_000234 [Centaurea solstitialis]
MLSPAAALFSSFLASPVGMGSGRGVLPTASILEAATLSSPGLKPRADKFIEVGSNTDNEPNLSKVKAPNAGSFVDYEGKVHLHADETDVAHKPVSFADLLKKSVNLVCGKGKLTYYPPVVTELGTRRAIIPDELIQKQASEWALTLAGYFIDYEIISRIASVVGEPVSVDRYTDEMCETKSGRANFARVLVNVSADYELPSDIDAIILGKLRKFKTEFLWKPKRCSHCKVFGHDFEMCVIRPRTTDEVKKVNPDVGESSKPKDDGFNFPRKKKPKPTVDPLKGGPKVAGIKINQRYVPKVSLPTTDPLDKGKSKLNDDNPSPKAPKVNTKRIPVKVFNQFTTLEEDPHRTKLDYFIGRWERVFGKEPDGSLREFTLPDRQIISDDDGSDSDSEDDAELLEDAPSDATLETPYGIWLRQKHEIDRRLAEKDWPTATQMASWTEKQMVYFFEQCEQLSEDERQQIPKTEH